MSVPRRHVRFTRAFYRDLAILAIVLAAACSWGIGALIRGIRLRQLREEGLETTGTVIAVTNSKSGYLVRYRFDIDGRGYDGTLATAERRHADRYTRGDLTSVTYLGADPQFSVPRAKREIDASFVDHSVGPSVATWPALAAFLAIVLAAFVAYAIRQRHLLMHCNIIGGEVTGAASRSCQYRFLTPAGDTYDRVRRLFVRANRLRVGERVDVCWMPGKPEGSRLLGDVRYVRIDE